MLVTKPERLSAEEPKTMEPSITYHLAQARIDEFRHQAQLDALIRAARQERRSHRRSSAHPAPARAAFGRRVLAALGVRAA
jgi:hypothetical protein